jgi:hypothetical protein
LHVRIQRKGGEKCSDRPAFNSVLLRDCVDSGFKRWIWKRVARENAWDNSALFLDSCAYLDKSLPSDSSAQCYGLSIVSHSTHIIHMTE